MPNVPQASDDTFGVGHALCGPTGTPSFPITGIDAPDPCFDQCGVTLTVGPQAALTVMAQIVQLPTGLYAIRFSIAVSGAAGQSYACLCQVSRDNVNFENVGVLGVGSITQSSDRLDVTCYLRTPPASPAGSVVRIQMQPALVVGDSVAACIQTKRLSR